MKKQALAVGFCCIICVACVYFLSDMKQKEEAPAVVAEEKPVVKNESVVKPVPKQTAAAPKSVSVKKTNLYGTLPNNLLPLSGISLLADLPENIKDKVDNLLDTSQGLYYINQNGDKITIVMETSEECPRHGIGFVEINTADGEQSVKPLGLEDKNTDSENDFWKYDEKTNLPLKHTKYNEDKEVEYVEQWNYSEDEPVKYEMKDGDGKILAIKKEIMEGDAGMRLENIIYDKEGNIKQNVSASYDGADITRFTYYDSEAPQSGTVIMSEYVDGLKTKETVYTSDFKVKNVYKAEYSDGERKGITVFDSANKEVGKFLAE